MKIENTNYEGDWNDVCEFCGKKQNEHKIELGKNEDTLYYHRQPCEEEQYQIIKKYVYRGIITKSIILIYDIGIYVWNRIPFKKEGKILWKVISHIFLSACSIIKLKNNKHNK